ncbi:hypothetical protein ROHU_019410 [Labeo rohita]|uniref:Uncharacterized protein n=1 Tax=Labeo rohita TaxID=84645 RepID=A0A498N225_LABRO|nr:hypothetical protein ROHU_019410 [Labeo rohita]
MYAVLDEQSKVEVVEGRSVTNFIIEPKNGKLQIQLPTLIECDMIPDDRKEIPSPEVVRHHPHLQVLADKIPAVDPNASILLLLGLLSGSCHLQYIPVGAFSCDGHHNDDNINCFIPRINSDGTKCH